MSAANKKILVVDDEPQILRFLRPGLTAAGYDVVTAETGEDALKLAAQMAPDAILLDLGLPDMDGKDVLKTLRAWSKTPVIVLSARDREAEKIAALDFGADDYVNKPFGIGELTARLRTALRHAAAAKGESTRYESEGIVVDIERHSVTLGGRPLRLTPKEFELLAMLVRNAGRIVTHRHILTAVWGPAHAEDLQYLRVLIGQLRQKLGADPAGVDLIETEPGIGYRFRSGA